MAPERNRSNDKSLQIKFYEPAGPARSHRVARQQFLVDGASAAGNVIFRRYQPQSVTSQQPPDLPPPCPLAAVLSPPHESEFSSSPPPLPPPPPPTPTPCLDACPRIIPLQPSPPPSPLPSPPPPLSPLPLLPLLLTPSPLPAPAISETNALLVAAILLGASSPSLSQLPEGSTEEAAECGDSERDFAEMWRSFIQFED
ncbi:hypothetical protein P692DRAFT_20869370 [Suillus brevipes Sb2]|nr:hypothetical protein P692DRAFT_20869370 [Suillus brevipes Sb2]